MKCKQPECEAEAYAIVHWPGGETEQCVPHCLELNALNKFMGGSDLLFTNLLTGQTMKVGELPEEELSVEKEETRAQAQDQEEETGGQPGGGRDEA